MTELSGVFEWTIPLMLEWKLLLMAASFITTISIDISHMWHSMKYKRLKGDKKRGTISELSYSSLGGVMNRQ